MSMRPWTGALVAVTIAVTAPCALAQAPAEKRAARAAAKASPPAGQPAAAGMPQPPPEMGQLEAMAGVWKCAGKVNDTSLGPGHGTRSMVNFRPDPALGGFWYTGGVNEAKTPDNRAPLRARFHQTYDPAGKQHVMVWVDNHGGWSTETSPGWQGDKQVWNGEASMMGKKVPVRDTFVKKAEAEMSHTSELSLDGKWVTVGEETCTHLPPKEKGAAAGEKK